MNKPTLEGHRLRLTAEQTTPLRSGAIHYWRLQPSAWRPALASLRAMGLQMVETYVPWGVHEVAPGEFDFGDHDPRKDLGAFLDLAAEEGLTCFLRPGPHINAELTYFGLPERIVQDPQMQARTPRGNPVVLYFPPRMFPVPSYASDAYHQEVEQWYAAVAKVVAPRIAPDGPVVLLQVDNEAGFYFRNGPFCQDYHDDALRAWRAFLVRRYGNEAAAQTAFGLEGQPLTPPSQFGEGLVGETPPPSTFRYQLTWAEFQETLLTDALRRMRAAMERTGLCGVPIVHNVSLGEAGLPMDIPALADTVDIVGLDYYHPAADHAAIKRRTLYLSGTLPVAYAPELGVGAPPWFTPLSHADSLYTAMTASAYGLRGFNLYMAVDRDRWYGAPIDASGESRAESVPWQRLLSALERTRFDQLQRDARVALVIPREYTRFTRATHQLGMISPAVLEAFGGAPTAGCRRDDLGLGTPIQIRWWDALQTVAQALDNAGIPYEYVDSGAIARRTGATPEGAPPSYAVAYAPTFRFADVEGRRSLNALAEWVVLGPETPTLNADFERAELEANGADSIDFLDVFDTGALHAALIDWIDRFGLARPYVCKGPIETTIHRRVNPSSAGEDAVLFIINPTVEAQDAQIRLPAPCRAVDVLTEETFEGESTLHVPMAGRTVRMLELLPPHEQAQATTDGEPS